MKYFLAVIFLFSITFCYAQNSWKKITSEHHKFKSKNTKILNHASVYDLYSLNLKTFKQELPNKNIKKTIYLPNIEGGFSKFRIKKTSNFTHPLSKQYHFIQSFDLIGVNDKTAKGKISVGKNEISVTIYSGKHSTFYIDIYNKEDGTFIAYQGKNLQNSDENFSCQTIERKLKKVLGNNIQKRNSFNGTLRIFRLALACTGEYAQFHIDRQGVSFSSETTKKAAVLEAMNRTITRINGIYERDLGVKFNIVINTNGENPLIFLDSNTDNLTNNRAKTLINESQIICDNIIGNANYDIGHTFSTGAGGLAVVGAIYYPNEKAKGVTGTSNPIGDAYNVDFVAHEIGHQLGASHTFNGDVSGCGGGNRSDENAVEPGSGSTIMGYAGLCGRQNIQYNSNDYFHSTSITSMKSVLQKTPPYVVNNLNNTSPTANAGRDVSVPKLTPLILKGKASDPEGINNLTYCWEQIDTEISTQPPVSSSTGGPLFRSLPPTKSPNRYLPDLLTVIQNRTSSTWEVLPNKAREMNFSLTVRDNFIGGGATDRDDMKITVTNADPFLVTSQQNNVTWLSGSPQKITWNTSETNIAPINCKYVRIKLSTDGGVTFPTTLINSTENDGSCEIITPNINTNKARIMVEAIDNIFYNVNKTNFTIDATTPSFTISNTTGNVSLCNIATNEITYTFNFNTYNNFNENVAFSLENSPDNAVIEFSKNSLNADNSFSLKISELENIPPKEYVLTLNATSNSVSKKLNFILNINNGLCISRGNNNSKISTTLVNFADIDNPSDKISGYANYKFLSTGVVRGETYKLTINTSSDKNNPIYSFAWFDWNQNCKFEENERIELGSTSTENSITKNIFIGKNVEIGNTTLRIISSSTPDIKPNSCVLDFDGETEDYTIIVEKDFANSNDLFNDLNVFPIPSDGKINIEFKVKDRKYILITLFDVTGRKVNSKEFSTFSNVFSKEINLNNVSSGIYFLQIENGGKRISKKILIH